jgi:DNA-binding winged helix-turn-helix (wHTH) protein
MKTQALIRFGDFELDASERTLTRAGVPVSLSPKAFDLLIALAEQPGKLRTKQDLLDTIWPDTAVEEATLGRHISDLRKALGSDQRYIETVTRHGYRFVAEARAREAVSETLTEGRSGNLPYLVGDWSGDGGLLAGLCGDSPGPDAQRFG